jgi:hypothetical protein
MVRIEIYLPDLPNATYQNQRWALANELAYTFGGRSISAATKVEPGNFCGSPVFSGKRHRIQPTVICGTLYLV